SFWRSMTIERLLRLSPAKYALVPLRPGPTRRITSPPGGSTFTTSAPCSASTIVASGPDMFMVRSITRYPAGGPLLDILLDVLLDMLLDMGRQYRSPYDAPMAGQARDRTVDDVRREVRAWIAANWEQDLALVEWRRRLAASGWAVPSWPREWFGR